MAIIGNIPYFQTNPNQHDDRQVGFKEQPVFGTARTKAEMAGDGNGWKSTDGNSGFEQRNGRSTLKQWVGTRHGEASIASLNKSPHAQAMTIGGWPKVVPGGS